VLFQIRCQLQKINLLLSEEKNHHLVLIADSWKYGMYTLLCYTIEKNENEVSYLAEFLNFNADGKKGNWWNTSAIIRNIFINKSVIFNYSLQKEKFLMNNIVYI